MTDFELQIIDDLHEEVAESGEYMNEEELKAKMVSLIFYVAKLKERKKIAVFYERSLSGTVKDAPLAVICDCVIATPRVNTPDIPYFFLQESKKSKGEKKDPEAQMLIAMLIAQQKNNDNKPIYGGYLLETGWQFTTLIGNDYCVSHRLEVSVKSHLLQTIYVLRQLKTVILER